MFADGELPSTEWLQLGMKTGCFITKQRSQSVDAGSMMIEREEQGRRKTSQGTSERVVSLSESATWERKGHVRIHMGIQ